MWILKVTCYTGPCMRDEESKPELWSWDRLSSMVSIMVTSRLLNENSVLTEPSELSNMKRHSEGTFSNDYSKYLETRRAQDFVQWLKNSKRNGWVCLRLQNGQLAWAQLSPVCSDRSLFRRHADGTYTSDVSTYLQDQAAKEFVSWLKTGPGRREWTRPRPRSPHRLCYRLFQSVLKLFSIMNYPQKNNNNKERKTVKDVS